MTLSARFSDRAKAIVIAPQLDLTVQRISASAQGGYKAASVQARGDEYALRRVAGWLGYRLYIDDGEGRTVWAGMVDDVTLHLGARVLSLNFRNMYNSLQVQYQALASGGSGTGVATLTSAATHAVSIANYGTRSLMVSGYDVYTQAAAEQKRDQMLAYYALPRVQRDNYGRGGYYAEIRASGLWSTLNWLYYANASTGNIVTSTQLSAIITAAGQFIEETRIINASGISTNEYRDGQGRAGDECTQLLDIGTTNNRRLLASLDIYDRLTIYEEPARAASDWRIDAEGRIRDNYGVVQPPWTLPGVGKWIADGDGLTSSLDSALLADPAAFFCEAGEYDAASGTYTPTPRGGMSPFEFLKLGAQ